MKEIKNNMKYLMAIISFLLSLTLLFTLLIINYGKNDKVITISKENNNQFQISEIRVGGTNKKLTDFIDKSNKYDEEYNFLYNETEKPLVLKVNSLKNIKITFIKNKNNALVNITSESKYKKSNIKINTNKSNIEFIDYYDNTTIPGILNYYSNHLNFQKIVLLIIYLITMTIVFYLMINKIDKIILKNRDLKISEISIIFTFLLFIFFSHIYLLIEIFNWHYIFPFFLIIFLFYIRYKKFLKKIQNIFLLFSITIGMIFIYANPPFNVPDEGAHYLKAYSLTLSKSEKAKYIENKNTYDAIIKIPKSVISTMDNYMSDLSNPGFELSTKVLLSDFNKKIENNYNSRTEFWFGNTHTLNAFCYIPSLIMVKISRIFNMSVIFSVILSRAINLFIFITLIYKSIIIVPKFKKTFLTVGLLPIVIQQSAAINQDSITHSLSIFLIALIIQMAFSKNKIKYSQLINVGIVGVMLSFCKIGYFPLLFLLFLIPKNKYENKKMVIVTISIIILSIIMTFLNYKMINNANTISPENFYTINMIFKQPIGTLKIFARTYFERFPLDQINGLINGFGYSTKWGKFNIFTFIIQNIALLLYLTANKKETKDKIITIKQKIIIFLVMIMIIGIIYVALLTGHSPNDTLTVCGLQSRYFIPTLPLLLIIISNNIITLKVKEESKTYFIVFSIIMIITMVTLIQGFYV